MSKPRLFYFDAPVSRGEECRLALHLAGVDFEDVRIKVADWPALKERMPYGALPVLEAARHEGMMQHVEDLRSKVSPTLRMGEAEKKAAREALVADYLPAWARAAERNIERGPFFGGERVHVVDLKIYMAVRWFNGGKVDHIPATVFADYPKLTAVHDAVRDHPGVKSWYARTSSP
jgi:glutathione S-transferase